MKPPVRRTSLRMPACLLLALALLVTPARADANVIQDENARPGTPNWRLFDPARQHEIEGYASRTSVARGDTIRFFVSTPDSQYTLEIFRMGWYGGAGARRVLGPLERAGIAQAMPVPAPATGLVECHWRDPFELAVPDDPGDPTEWASGVYLVRLTAGTTGRQSFIPFVVRDDARFSEFLFPCSVTTWQAYNAWGGESLYQSRMFSPAEPDADGARKVSFDRPYAHTDLVQPDYDTARGAGQFLSYEYHMVRFLEREGVDVAYCTSLDVHHGFPLAPAHRTFLSIGHDEYWSWEMRRNVEAARDRGDNLAFFSGNTCYWQFRLEPSTTGDSDRTMACYKGHALTEDPLWGTSLTSDRWRDRYPGMPEDDLIGVMYAFGGQNMSQPLVIQDASHWACAGTGLESGDVLSRIVGNEADRVVNNTRNVRVIGHSFVPPQYCQDGWLVPCVPYADVTSYTAESGAQVFAAGSIFWSLGVDDYGVSPHDSRLDPRVQQITRNVFDCFRGAATGLSAAFGDTGATVLVTGRGLSATTAVRFGDAAAEFTVQGDTLVAARVPAGAGAGRIRLANACGTLATDERFDPPGWPLDGRPVARASGDESDPVAVADGAGGAIVAWVDRRGADADVYVQRLRADGQPLWPEGGVALRTVVGDASAPAIASDGAGGAIVAWRDGRAAPEIGLFAQRVDSAGVVRWSEGGVALATGAADVRPPALVADGAGGAIVAWAEARDGLAGIVLQALASTGTVRWPGGVPATAAAAATPEAPALVADGAGGAIVAWSDHRGGNDADIHAQRFDADGAPRWMPDGAALSLAPGEQARPIAVVDGAGGAVVAWEDRRTPVARLFVQRVDSTGAALWAVDGVAADSGLADVQDAAITGDGAGGAILAWSDRRGGVDRDAFAQHVDSAGVARWSAAGGPVSMAVHDQVHPVLASDEQGGAVIAWEDHRSANTDVYAQHLDARGAPLWSEGAKPVCSAARDQVRPTIAARGAGETLVAWRDARDADSLGRIYAADPAQGSAVAGVGPGPLSDRAVSAAWPNPFRRDVSLAFELARGAMVRLEVYDVAGRRVRARPAERLAAGRHTWTWDGRGDDGHALRAGVYFVRLTGLAHAVTRAVVRVD